MLPYQLVERQLQRPYQTKQLPVLCLAAACDVCRLTRHVLTRRTAAHCLVQLLTAIAAVHLYGLAERTAQRVEHLVNQRGQIGAAVMAAQGYSYTDIVSHYFPHTVIKKMY